MATDPVRRIRRTSRASEPRLNLTVALRRLAALPPSANEPYLTIHVDWRADGANPGLRPARAVIERELAALADTHGPRGPVFDLISEAGAELSGYLADELDPSSEGAAIVAGGPGGVFEAVPLPVAVPTQVALAPIPFLFTLARIEEDHPAFGVLVADQRDAVLWLVEHAVPIGTVEVSGTDYPRRQKTGGNAERRYRARADERIGAFARVVAAEVRAALDEQQIDALLVAGDEIIASALEAEWHPSVRERVRGQLRLPVDTPEDVVLAAALPVELAGERAREFEQVRAVLEHVGSGGAATGAEAVLRALKQGQVRTLVVADDFAADGWADYEFPLAGIGAVPREHPAGGDPAAIVAVPAREELIRLAFATGADVEIVHGQEAVVLEPGETIPDAGQPMPRTEAATLLDAAGGVGAIFRFVITPAEPASSNAYE